MSALATEVRIPTPAPLRNRMRIKLDATPAQVWALVGDLARLPEYSAGLERVDVKADARGRPTEYTCYFKAQQAGEAGIASRDVIRWYEPGRGWASASPDEVDVFGIRDSLHQVTVEPSGHGTLVIWIAHYDADDPDALAAYRKALDEAYADIAERLIARFGGRLLARAVDTGTG